MISSKILASNALLTAGVLIVFCTVMALYSTWRRMQGVRDGQTPDSHARLRWLHQSAFAQWFGLIAGMAIVISAVFAQYEERPGRPARPQRKLDTFTNSVTSFSVVTNNTLVITTTTITTTPLDPRLLVATNTTNTGVFKFGAVLTP